MSDGMAIVSRIANEVLTCLACERGEAHHHAVMITYAEATALARMRSGPCTALPEELLPCPSCDGAGGSDVAECEHCDGSGTIPIAYAMPDAPVESLAKVIGDSIYGYVHKVETPNTWGSSVEAANAVITALREKCGAALSLERLRP